MKTSILVSILALGLGTQAHANFISADQIYTNVRCERLVTVPDLGLSVEVQSGGIAGLTQVVINESFLGRNHVQTAIVKPSLADQGPAVYEGNGVKLEIDFNSAPDVKNGFPSELTVVQPNNQVQTEKLSCQALFHTM